MKTVAGSNFMIAFNAWYYSFSPYVASNIQQHWAERTIMKGVLYPLVGILWVSSTTFNSLSLYPEVAALVSGLLASSMIGVVYVGLPLAIVQTRLKRLRDRWRQRNVQAALKIMLALSLLALVVGELYLARPLLISSTVTIILSTLLLAAAISSEKIANVFG